nr:ATP-binding protein [Szabonella alba]
MPGLPSPQSSPPPRRPRATLRLAALVAGVVIALSLTGMALQYRLISDRLMEAQHRLLAAEMEGFGALYDQRRVIALREAIAYRAASASGAEMLLLQDRAGAWLAGTRSDWPSALPPAGAGFRAGFGTDQAQVFTEDGQRWLGVGRLLPGGFPLLVAQSLAPMDATLAALRRGMAGLGAAMLLASALAGWWAARRVMARLARVNRLADRVAAGDLQARLPGPAGPDEFGQLETHVHAMLDRISALNRATHRLSDHIAHELRTPLNRIAQRVAALDAPPARQAELQEEIRATIRVFDALLDISRAEADQGDGSGLRPVDLSALCTDMAELYAPLAEDQGLTLTEGVEPGLRVLGDATLIGQILANLLDNAVKYCRPGDAVHLALTQGGAGSGDAKGGGRILLSIRDTGPGLPPELRAGGFERFARGARDRDKPGHGLGLALVQAIAARHGAKLHLPQTESGFALEIDWPGTVP